MAERNWKLKPISPGKYKVRLVGTNKYTKTVKSKEEALQYKNQMNTQLDSLKDATAYEKVQKGRTPDKLRSYVDKWNKLNEIVSDATETDRSKELAKRQLKSLLGRVDKAGLKNDFHEQILNIKIGHQIFEDPDTGKRYKFVGPDRDDPNSYEEI